jgi:CheY-like chemotaxis protein
MTNGKTVLVVEDEAQILKIMEIILRSGGYDVLTASDGATALRIVEESAPDALVTDLTMPGLSGRELCVRTDPLKQERPFLTVVVSGRLESEERGWISHMTDTRFLLKPFSPSGLKETVDEYFAVPA